VSSEEPGYVLRVSDRTTAAMQLAAHFTAEAMKNSATEDPRARLAEQLGFFDLAFRSIMGSTARGIINAGGSQTASSSDAGTRHRLSSMGQTGS
jgi:DhnA family fructose-bisphosphate aldolase class Ia